MHKLRHLTVAGIIAGLGLIAQSAPAQERLVSAEDSPSGGRLEIHEIEDTPGASQTVAVWLPPGYETSDQHYPVAYLLHGSGQTYAAFTDTSDTQGSVVRLANEGRIEAMILVMPTRPRTDIPSWMSPDFWDYVATDIVGFTDRRFRTLPSRSWRAVGGFSMGGMDAMMIALSRPDVFGHVGSIDGASVPCPPCELDNPELRERLQLHQQFRFPLSMWIEWGTASFLPAPRPVQELLDALGLPYAYVETANDHMGSLKNVTDDFIVYFSDAMQDGSAEPSPSGRVTEHLLAHPGSLLDIEVDMGRSSVDLGADLRIDLSSLGLEPVLMDHDGSGRYTAVLRLPEGVANTVYALPVARVGAPSDPQHLYGIRLTVLPASDLVILDGDADTEWILGNARNIEEVSMAAGETVFGGSVAARIQGKKSFAGWSVPFVTGDSVSAFGYSALRFAFAPGAVVLEEGDRFAAHIGGRGISLWDRLDFSRPAWQTVEIPLDSLDLPKEVVGHPGFKFVSVAFSGSFAGEIYINDLRLVAREAPAAATAVLEEQNDRQPRVFALQQNYPNPFNSSTTIAFRLPEAAAADLAVYNLAGQKVATLVDGWRSAGTYRVTWDARSDVGRPLASGVYLYRLRAGSRVESRRLLLVR